MGEGTGVGAEQGHKGIATRLVSPQCLTVWIVTELRRQPGTCYYRDSRCREGGRGQNLWRRVNGIGEGPGVYSGLSLAPPHQEEQTRGMLLPASALLPAPHLSSSLRSLF